MHRSRIFFQGGPGWTARKQSGRCFGFFFSPQLILQFTEGVQCFITEKTTVPRIQSGSNFFQGGGGGGVQMLISKETHLTCDFPGGGGVLTLSPSLDPHM